MSAKTMLGVVLLVLFGAVGCDSNDCALGVKGAQSCSGYTSSGDFYFLEYNEDEQWFYGSLWCGGRPNPGHAQTIHAKETEGRKVKVTNSFV